MNIILKKVNNFEDIKERSLYAITNVDNTEYAIAAGNLVSFLTYKAIKKTEDEVVEILKQSKVIYENLYNVSFTEEAIKKCVTARQWWRTPLIPALGRQRQVDF